MSSTIQNLYEYLKEEFKQVARYEESGYSAFSFSVNLFEVILKINCFIEDGFDDFCILETIRKLNIPQLYSDNDMRLKEEYESKITEGIAELIVKTDPDCKKYVIRTVINCTPENYISMVQELLQIHLKIHSDTAVEMEKKYRIL